MKAKKREMIVGDIEFTLDEATGILGDIDEYVFGSAAWEEEMNDEQRSMWNELCCRIKDLVEGI